MIKLLSGTASKNKNIIKLSATDKINATFSYTTSGNKVYLDIPEDVSMAKYSFSKKSLKNLSTCHIDLQRLYNEVIKEFDCTILCGHRNETEQNKAVAEGNSTKKWPESNHNTKPSTAVDAIPYPIDFKDREEIIHFAGYVFGIAQTLGIKIRWGGSWKGFGKLNKDYYKDPFDDLVHWELV